LSGSPLHGPARTQKKGNEISQLCVRIEADEHDIGEIKTLLRQLLAKKGIEK